MLDRPEVTSRIHAALLRSPICALLGPRQCGKTTLASTIDLGKETHRFDLESPRDLLRLQNPENALTPLKGLIIIDEIQLRPDLFPILRVLADRPNHPACFLILGSASPQLVKNSSESLAGRVEFIDLHGFHLQETGHASQETLWLRGGFPRAFLAESEEDSLAWREGFIRTFLERDLPNLGIRIPAPALRRFWTMLSHAHGQISNHSKLGRSLGISDNTIRSYIDLLTQTYMLRQLQPWHENLGKRQVKSPKLYLRDSGLTHHLLGIQNHDELLTHPILGASWEGFLIEQILALCPQSQAYFWATQSGAELDLLLQHKGKRLGFECKRSEQPTTTRSMRIAMQDLHLDHLYLIAPVHDLNELEEKITILGPQHLHTISN